jgi:hypothetical protein
MRRAKGVTALWGVLLAMEPPAAAAAGVPVAGVAEPRPPAREGERSPSRQAASVPLVGGPVGGASLRVLEPVRVGVGPVEPGALAKSGGVGADMAAALPPAAAAAGCTTRPMTGVSAGAGVEMQVVAKASGELLPAASAPGCLEKEWNITLQELAPTPGLNR